MRLVLRGWRWVQARLPRALLNALGISERVRAVDERSNAMRSSADVGVMLRAQRAHDTPQREAETSARAPREPAHARLGGSRPSLRRVPQQAQRAHAQQVLPAAQPAPAPALGPSLLRQKTISPQLVEQLEGAIALVQEIGLDLGGGLLIPPSFPVRKQHLVNREVTRAGGELLGTIRCAVEQLETVGYTDGDVRKLLHERAPSLAWLGERSLASARLADGSPGRPARALRGRVRKWCALQAVRFKATIGSAGAEPLLGRKQQQGALIAALRASTDALSDAVQIGVAEAEEQLCEICFERPRTIVLQHAVRRGEDRHQVCEPCLAQLMQSNARCPFCNEAVAYV